MLFVTKQSRKAVGSSPGENLTFQRLENAILGILIDVFLSQQHLT